MIKHILTATIVATIAGPVAAFQECPTGLNLAWTPTTETGWYERTVGLQGDWFIVGDGLEGMFRFFNWTGTTWVEVEGAVADGVATGDGATGQFVVEDDIVLVSAMDRIGLTGLIGVGAVDVGLLSSGTPTLTSVVNPPLEIEYGLFGHSIAIELPWVAIAQDDGEDGSLIHMYTTDGITLTYQNTLVWGDSIVSHLSLSDNLLVAGAKYEDAGAIPQAGAVITWTLDGATWSHANTLTAEVPEAYSHWGFHSNMSDGQLLVSTGGFYVSGGASPTASVLLYTWSGEQWVLQQTFDSPRVGAETNVNDIVIHNREVFILWWEKLSHSNYRYVIDYWSREGDTLVWAGMIDSGDSDVRSPRRNLAVKDGMLAFDGGLDVDGISGQQDRGIFLVPIVDCNNNNRADECEIESGSAIDANADDRIDSCFECDGDWNHDGHVDVSDLIRLIVFHWGTPDADLTGDGETDVRDLVAMLLTWNDCG
jgi:hypothetical protein